MGELIGAVAGGYLCDRFERRLIAGIGFLMLIITALSFGLTAGAWFEPGYPHVILLPAFKGFLAMLTVSMFSLYMKISWTKAAATQYTLYMAANNVGYAIGAKLLAWLEYFGYRLDTADFYVLAGAMPILPLLLLTRLDPAAVERRKIADREALAAGVA